MSRFYNKKINIAGFGFESFEEFNSYSSNISIDFTNIFVAMILISLIGAIIDTSVAISSAVYEVYLNNTYMTKKELFKL
ncbi:MAG: YibE/F family protein [Bacilli bacterium]